jgi:putative NIF3 family GTP cyclohydrolase 1 type 2
MDNTSATRLAAEALRIAHPHGSPGHLTHATLAAFFNLLLPAATTHLPLLYHTPRQPKAITRLILSVTATPGIYPLLTPTTAVFLHRPWDLDRRKVKPSTIVLASHQRLDELLTTGYNVELLRRFGCTQPMEGVVGYKGDPERKIGLVARLPGDSSLEEWIRRINAEFEGLESVVPGTAEERDAHTIPRFIACVNAFEPDTIDRAVDAVRSLETATEEPATASRIIYLTGQPRPLGTAHANTLDMPCVFTGHRRAEAWAVRYLAEMVQDGFGVEVVVVDEEAEEEEMQRRKKEMRAEKITRTS